MVIVIDTGAILASPDGYGYYLYECFRRIASANPGHEFVFLASNTPAKEFLHVNNSKIVIAGPGPGHPMMWKFWYDLKIPGILKKYKADIFVCCDNRCSLTTRIPQCLLVRDLNFHHNPFLFKKTEQAFYKRNAPKFIKKAARIVTFSSFIKNEIERDYSVAKNKISVVAYAVKDIFRPVSDKIKLAIKDKYTRGVEYFISTGPIESSSNLQNLLKAFSIFKKRQASNWKLVVTGEATAKSKSFLDSLKTYKYREDIVVTGHLADEELAPMLASAYALLVPSFDKGLSSSILEAARSNVAILSAAGSSLHQVAPAAALFADPLDHHDIAEKIMLLYKDENLRSRLIENAKALHEQFNWSSAASQLWQAIQATASAQPSPRK